MYFKNSNYFKLVSTNFSNNTNASILFEVQVQHHGHAITFLFAAVTSLLGLSKCKILLLCIFATSYCLKISNGGQSVEWIAKKLLSCCLRFHAYICANLIIKY